MAKIRAIKTLQKFAAAHASIHNHFNQERHLKHRDIFKQNRSEAMAEWRQSGGVKSETIQNRCDLLPFALTTPAKPFRGDGRVASAGGVKIEAIQNRCDLSPFALTTPKARL